MGWYENLQQMMGGGQPAGPSGIGTTVAPPEAPAPAAPPADDGLGKISAILDGMNVGPDERKLLEGYAKLQKLSAPKNAYEEMGMGKALVGSIGAGAIAGLSRWGGADHNSAVAQGLAPINAYMGQAEKVSDGQRAAFGEVGKSALDMGSKGMAERRKLAQAAREKVQLLQAYGRPVPPALLEQAGMGGPATPGAPAAPSAASVPTPQAARQAPSMPSGPGGPAAAPTLPAGGQMGPEAPPVASGAPAPAGGSGRPPTRVGKYGDYQPTYTPDDIISSAIMTGDVKDLPNLQMKQNEIDLKRAELTNSQKTNDPEQIAANERARGGAQNQNALEKSALERSRDTTIAGQGVTTVLQELYDMADEKVTPGFDSTIGPVDGFSPWGMNIGGIIGAPKTAWAGGEKGYTEIRSDIDMKVGTVAALMKKFVRAGGEGAWSDKDQEGLEKMIGDLKGRPDSPAFRRGVQQVHNHIKKAFVDPNGGSMPDLKIPATTKKDDSKTPTTTMTPEQSSAVMKRYQEVDEAGREAIRKDLQSRGMSLEALQGGPPMADQPLGPPESSAGAPPRQPSTAAPQGQPQWGPKRDFDRSGRWQRPGPASERYRSDDVAELLRGF